MPDITMCANPTCPVRQTCKRHEASGTIPKPIAQSWFIEQSYGSKGCDYYWQAAPEEASAA